MTNDDVAWLDPTQQRHWRATAMGMGALTSLLSRDLEASAGLSMAEYEILVRLSEAPDDRLRMSDLADEVVSSRSRLTHTIARLERAGLVERAKCPVDGRGVLALMTPKGRDLLEAVAPGHVASVRQRLVDILEPEALAALGDAMRAVAVAAGVSPERLVPPIARADAVASRPSDVSSAADPASAAPSASPSGPAGVG